MEARGEVAEKKRLVKKGPEEFLWPERKTDGAPVDSIDSWIFKARAEAAISISS